MQIVNRLADRLPAGIAVATLLALTSGASFAQTAPAPPPVRFAAAAPQSMVISGQAVLENGQPIPKFHVDAGGYSGKFNNFNNNTLGGPQVRQNGTTFGKADGANGRYSIRMTEDATMTKVQATAVFPYHGTNFTLDLWPTDNLIDGTGAKDFRGRTTSGIVRNFVLKLSGIRPGYDPAAHPDHETDTARDPGCYYGGTLKVSGWMQVSATPFPKNSTVKITLTPTAPRVDGLPATTVVRTCTLGLVMWLYGIPFGAYSASAQLTEPGGAVHNLRLTVETPSSDADFKSTAAPIEWCRWPGGAPKPDGSIQIPVNVWLDR